MVLTRGIGTSQQSSGVYEAKITLLRDEIQWLSKCPTSSLTAAFVFVNDPPSTAVFIMPSEEEAIQLNFGPHALQPDRSVNNAFLWAENHYCNMIKMLSRMKTANTYCFQLEDTEQIIFKELRYLNVEKAFQWTQQRGILLDMVQS